MRRLVVDDLRILENDEDVTYARTWKKGLHLLRTEEWDELYLDHDLMIVDPDTVRPLVTEMERRAYTNDEPFKVGTVFVITSNDYGALWITRALQQHYDVVDIRRTLRFKIMDIGDACDIILEELEEYGLVTQR